MAAKHKQIESAYVKSLKTQLRNLKKANVKPAGKQAGTLFPSKKNNPGKYLPRAYITPVDTKDAVTRFDRLEHLATARSLYATLPAIGYACNVKSSWCVGGSSYMPIFRSQDPNWNAQASTWTRELFFPMCSVMGPNYDFHTILKQTSVALDVDNESMMVLTKSRNNFPLIDIISSHRIGSRDNEKIVKEGKYAGYEINDGVIISNKRPIAYNFLGDTPEEDYQLSAQNCQLLFESEFLDQYRGISKLARPSSDLLDAQDIKEFLKEQTKLISEQGLMVHTESGEPDDGTGVADTEDDPTAAVPVPVFEPVRGAGFRYFKANSGEKIEAISDDRPNPNALEFVAELYRGALASIGWSSDLMNPKNLSGAPTRLVQDLIRQSISDRQDTLDKRAKLIISYAIAVAMVYGFLPVNNGDWWNFSFTYGNVLCVDTANEAQADREGYKMGLIPMSNITAKQGYDWKEVRNQVQAEVEDLVDRALDISKRKGIPYQEAKELLRQTTPNLTAPPETLSIGDNNAPAQKAA